MSMPFFLFILLGLMRYADAFRQIANTKVAARHVGEARLYMPQAGAWPAFAEPHRISLQHTRGRPMTIQGGPERSYLSESVDEWIAAGVISFAATTAPSPPALTVLVEYGLKDDGESTGTFAATARSTLPEIRLWPLPREASWTFRLTTGTWQGEHLRHPSLIAVQTALIAGVAGSDLSGALGSVPIPSEDVLNDARREEERGRWN